MCCKVVVSTTASSDPEGHRLYQRMLPRLRGALLPLARARASAVEAFSCSRSRALCTGERPGGGPGTEEETDGFEVAPDRLKEEYLNESGEVTLSLHRDMLFDDSFDWAEIERIAGISGDDSMFAPDGAEDEEFEMIWSAGGVLAEGDQEVHIQKAGDQNDVGCGEGKSEHERDIPGKRREPSLSLNTVDFTDDPVGVRTRFQAAKLQSADAAVACEELPPHATNKQRPGYERRVMSMEREMERIVEEVLHVESAEWEQHGCDTHHVGLSANMRDLTIFYDLDIALSGKDAAAWKRTLKRLTGAVRSELASRLDIRYAPRVHFQNGMPGDGDRDCKSDRRTKLDDAFARIAEERQG